MHPLLLLFVGCGISEWVTGEIDAQGISALDEARNLVQEAEDSPGKRRVLRLLRKLERDIESGDRSGVNGNVVAAAVTRVAKDGSISSTEAGVIEDAYVELLDGELSRGRKGRRGRRGRPDEASEGDGETSKSDDAPTVQDL